MANTTLSKARDAKKDEFYTRLEDIGNELKHYRRHFAGKTVLCNCDDPYESNFFKFFAMKFNSWGLKRLICTCWGGSTVAQTELDFGEDYVSERPAPYGGETITERRAYKIDLTYVADLNGDGCEDLNDIRRLLELNPPELLQGNGDFRSAECVALLQEADIVVTNPPFSLFREYVAQLVKYDKKFLIIGNKNAITYKEIFSLIKTNRMWVGYTPMTKDLRFIIPQSYIEDATRDNRKSATAIEDGKVLGRSPSIWFTNLDHSKRHTPLDLYKHYTPEEYPTYDNYNAIEVSKTVDIPMDYDGAMGVPITFMDKYCPEQFEIIGNEYDLNIPKGRGYVNGKRMYGRIFIKRK